jgi:hypothetical protein
MRSSGRRDFYSDSLLCFAAAEDVVAASAAP